MGGGGDSARIREQPGAAFIYDKGLQEASPDSRSDGGGTFAAGHDANELNPQLRARIKERLRPCETPRSTPSFLN